MSIHGDKDETPTGPALPEALGIRLTKLEEEFCWAYAETYSTGESYFRANPDSKASRAMARSYGAALLRKPHIRRRIYDIRQPALAQAGITLERTIKELGRVAFADARNLLNKNGGLKKLADLDDDTAAALNGIDTKGAGKDIGRVVGVKMADKVSALDKLMKHFGGYERDNAQRGENLAVQVLVVPPTREPRPD